MKTYRIKPAAPFSRHIEAIAPDKSISHRCAIFSLLSDQPSRVRNYLQGEDTLCTLEIVKQLGATVEENEGAMVITPPVALLEPPVVLDCGNSGTAMRLLMGFLAAREGFFVLHGDPYLAGRPMRRVADPLRSIGAQIDGRKNGDFSPIAIRGKHLSAFTYQSPIASAQVKSALLLAALTSEAPSQFWEPELSRDHTEKMLAGMGVQIEREGLHVKVYPPQSPLKPLDITVPSDPSSAYFFALAAAIVPGSCVVLKHVLLNPTRIEAFKVLERMGTQIEYTVTDETYESIGDIRVSYAPLHAVEVSENIAWLIDEIPALGIAFACASGVSKISGAKELRVKESDRIATTVTNLRQCGIEVHEFEDGFEVTGGTLQSAKVTSFGDHRIAMSFAIAGLVCGMEIDDTACIATSFPNFLTLLQSIGDARED
ncbi:MAG: 3-phosphoshikimate 1-carboxyvinyltransferase [Campylobacterales bacterium]|nr:3-phosphoshikimate 1-carboxyvinyltransferase [Campylobacterales bacterium]